MTTTHDTGIMALYKGYCYACTWTTPIHVTLHEAEAATEAHEAIHAETPIHDRVQALIGGMCGESTTSALGTKYCILERGHRSTHASGHGYYWGTEA